MDEHEVQIIRLEEDDNEVREPQAKEEVKSNILENKDTNKNRDYPSRMD